MLFLKLNLPEEVVSYNSLGVMTSTPVAHTPDKVKGIQANFSVHGYVADDAFYAFKMTSPDLPLTTQDQFRLMAQLGFKTIPVEYYPSATGAINALIKTKLRYEKYGATWWDMNRNQEYTVPYLAKINDISWTIDGTRRLARVLHTDKGDFDVIDHRAPEYYQVGLQVKINNGTVEPYQSCAITEDTPIYCPKCNNPLKKFQLSSDLPLIYKCKAPLCVKLAVTNPEEKQPEVNPEILEDDSFRNEAVDEVTAVEVPQEPVPELVTEESKKFRIVNLECEEAEWFSKVDVVTEEQAMNEGADYILTKSNRSVTKQSRDMANDTGIPLISMNRLEAMLSE